MKRQQYRFDHRGFRTPSSYASDSEDIIINYYRIFTRSLPTEYNVTGFTVGFNPGGGTVWTASFRP